jgi:hypothetical protein
MKVGLAIRGGGGGGAVEQAASASVPATAIQDQIFLIPHPMLSKIICRSSA